jgi:hypothetical protein
MAWLAADFLQKTKAPFFWVRSGPSGYIGGWEEAAQ